MELHYSPIEKEALGFTWLCERASDYILGKPIIGMSTSDTLSRLMARKSVSKDVNEFNEETEAYVFQFWTRSQSRTSNCSKLLKHKLMMKSVRLSSSIVLRTGRRDTCSQGPYVSIGQTVHI